MPWAEPTPIPGQYPSPTPTPFPWGPGGMWDYLYGQPSVPSQFDTQYYNPLDQYGNSYLNYQSGGGGIDPASFEPEPTPIPGTSPGGPAYNPYDVPPVTPGGSGPMSPYDPNFGYGNPYDPAQIFTDPGTPQSTPQDPFYGDPSWGIPTEMPPTILGPNAGGGPIVEINPSDPGSIPLPEGFDPNTGMPPLLAPPDQPPIPADQTPGGGSGPMSPYNPGTYGLSNPGYTTYLTGYNINPDGTTSYTPPGMSMHPMGGSSGLGATRPAISESAGSALDQEIAKWIKRGGTEDSFYAMMNAYNPGAFKHPGVSSATAAADSSYWSGGSTVHGKPKGL